MSNSKVRSARSDLLPKFVGYRDVQEAVGVSRRTIERMVRDGTFPKPRQLTPNRVGWRAEVITDWLASRQKNLLEGAVSNPSELDDSEVENALVSLAGRWLQRRTGRSLSNEKISIGDLSEPEILHGALARLVEFDGCFEHFDAARAILAAAWLFPVLRPMIEAEASPEAQAVFSNPELLRTLGCIAMDDEAWALREKEVEHILGRPADETE